MIGARAVVALGLAQLVAWGVSHYLIGVFGPRIVADLGWSRAVVYGGFSLALGVMGLASPVAGRLIDRHGGRRVMPLGSCAIAAGCLGLAAMEHVAVYAAAWVGIGIGMRLTLYDAAFASLARIGGSAARRAMSQITLFGGLASTTFWPLGEWLATQFGWRRALLAYAGFALCTVPLLRQLPAAPSPQPLATGGAAPASTASAALPAAHARAAGALYAVFVASTSFLVTGITSHLVALLGELGLAAATAVAVAALFGLGQLGARVWIAAHAHAMHPLRLNRLAAFGPPLAFAVAVAGAGHAAWAALFALAYGAANGIMTITRGTMPLALFDPAGYGARVGRLLAPAFFCAAAAPYAYALVVDRWGARGALGVSIAVALGALLAALRLGRLAPPRA